MDSHILPLSCTGKHEIRCCKLDFKGLEFIIQVDKSHPESKDLVKKEVQVLNELSQTPMLRRGFIALSRGKCSWHSVVFPE